MWWLFMNKSFILTANPWFILYNAVLSPIHLGISGDACDIAGLALFIGWDGIDCLCWEGEALSKRDSCCICGDPILFVAMLAGLVYTGGSWANTCCKIATSSKKVCFWFIQISKNDRKKWKGISNLLDHLTNLIYNGDNTYRFYQHVYLL